MNAQPESISPGLAEDITRTGLDSTSIKRSFLDHLFFLQGKFPSIATQNDYYMALSYLVRDRLLHRWISSAATYTREGSRTVAYLSAEFLMGPHLGNNLLNLGIFKATRDAMKELGLDLEIAADGSVSEGRLAQFIDAGCNHFICGTSALFKPNSDLVRNAAEFGQAVEAAII